jgi:hypothetical protein
MKVERISTSDTKDFILNKHYAGRMPGINYAFGLFEKEKLIGVLTIGKPASDAPCRGILGVEYKSKVYELNRLVINEGLPKNTLSWFVSQVLKILNREKIILISYADTAMNHHGYIYQATNWIYTGATAKRTDPHNINGKHPRHIVCNKTFPRKVRSSKHRYVWFSKKCRNLKSSLRWKILPYPKGDNSRYELGFKLQDEIVKSII